MVSYAKSVQIGAMPNHGSTMIPGFEKGLVVKNIDIDVQLVATQVAGDVLSIDMHTDQPAGGTTSTAAVAGDDTSYPVARLESTLTGSHAPWAPKVVLLEGGDALGVVKARLQGLVKANCYAVTADVVAGDAMGVITNTESDLVGPSDEAGFTAGRPLHAIAKEAIVQGTYGSAAATQSTLVLFFGLGLPGGVGAVH
jgi:hypothetical protein